MKTKVYISGPMRGYAEHNYPEFNKAAAELRHEGCIVINPAELCAMLGTPEEIADNPALLKAALALDCEAVATCDAVYLLRGWERSEGARTELSVALKHGLQVVQQKDGERPVFPPTYRLTPRSGI